MGIWVLIFYKQKLLSRLLTLCKSFVWLCEEMREIWPEGKVYRGRIEADHMKVRNFASKLWLAVNNWVVEVKRWNSQGGKMVENVRSWLSFVWIRLLVKKLCCIKKKTWSRYVEFWNGTWKPSLSYFACVIILYSLTNHSVSHQWTEIKIVMISFSFGRETPILIHYTVYGHTMLKTPVLVRSLKLSNIGLG